MIQWDETFATGHSQVDSDHRQIVASLNELELALQRDTDRDQAGRILTFLGRYTRDHFTREEAHMQRVSCPAYQENCRQHDALTVRLDSWIGRLQSDPSSTLVMEIHREISAWIRGHILKTDCKLRGCRPA